VLEERSPSQPKLGKGRGQRERAEGGGRGERGEGRDWMCGGRDGDQIEIEVGKQDG